MENNNFKNALDISHSELRVIRVFLISILIIIFYQALQLINIRSIDHKHKNVFVAKDNAINSLQTILFQSFNIQRALLNMAISEDSEEYDNMLERIMDSKAVIDTCFNDLEVQLTRFMDDDTSVFTRMKTARKTYQGAYGKYIMLIKNDQREDAIKFRFAELRPALDSYLALQQEMLKRITDASARESDKISQYASVSGIIFFILGFIPFILAIVYFIYASIKFRLWVSFSKVK